MADDKFLQRKVVVKLPIRDMSIETVLWFFKEARLATRINHPGVIQIYDFGKWYIVQEFIKGNSLTRMIQLEYPRFSRSVECLAHVAESLYYVHLQGIIHCDIKHDNMLLDASDSPRILDFGTAFDRFDRTASVGEYDYHLRSFGYSVPFAAPEILLKDESSIGPWSDVYSLGVTLYFILTLRYPFVGNIGEMMRQVLDQVPVSPRKVRRGVPRSLDDICMKAMAKDVTERFQSALEMAQALRGIE
jgi:serine/threonine protein kinase